MKQHKIIIISKQERFEFEELLNIDIEVDDYGDVEFEYRDYNVEDYELGIGKTYKDMSNDIRIKLIQAINEKYQTEIPDDAPVCFTPLGIGFIY